MRPCSNYNKSRISCICCGGCTGHRIGVSHLRMRWVLTIPCMRMLCLHELHFGCYISICRHLGLQTADGLPP